MDARQWDPPISLLELATSDLLYVGEKGKRKKYTWSRFVSVFFFNKLLERFFWLPHTLMVAMFTVKGVVL